MEKHIPRYNLFTLLYIHTDAKDLLFLLEEDIINIYESSEIKIIGLGVIDKFLSQTSSELINLTIIQPNILVLSILQVGIEDLLHQCEYTIM